jgi:hypothetical protein
MKTSYGLLLIMLLLMLAQSPTLAQVGIKGGIFSSDITFITKGQTPYLGYEISTLEHKVPRITYQIGLFTYIPMSERLFLQPELLYISQGLNYSTKYLYDDIQYKIRINYVQLPLLFKYINKRDKKLQTGFMFGPYGAIKTDAKTIRKYNDQKNTQTLKQVHDTDWGIILSLLLEMNHDKDKINFELRTTYSLFNMMDRIEGYIPMADGPKRAYARNVSLGIHLAYCFTSQSGQQKSIT